MKYVLDTNACIRFLNGSHPHLVQRVLRAGPSALAISTLSVGELCFGAARSSRPKANLARVQTLLAEISVLPFEQAAAERFGVVKAFLVAKGKRIGDMDVAIAATALVLDRTVVTSDADFQRIPALRCEDWSVEKL